MEKFFEVLRECPLFYHIEDADLLKMLGCLNPKIIQYNKNETIIAAGENAKNIGIVLSGSAQVTQGDYLGNRNIVTVAGPAQMFAEAFACAGVEHLPVDVVSNESSEVMLVDCMKIIGTCSCNCKFHRQMIYNLMKDIAQKNISFHQRVEITSKRSTREKLMAYLILQMQKTGENCFDIPFDRQALADYLGVERSGLSVEISKLRKEGIIKCSKNHFEIL